MLPALLLAIALLNALCAFLFNFSVFDAAYTEESYPTKDTERIVGTEVNASAIPTMMTTIDLTSFV
jgi:hypothetical protein